MDEIIYFNPGDAVAQDHDFAAARRSAEIFKAKSVKDLGLVVGKDDDGKFAVFYEGAAQDPHPGTEPATRYTILAHL
ncbi:hypothetical protein [Lacticaseibacillus parakribbianus]|uniref:hypothetical protein n=1 Tax=Lacticaseibacillus parakribbianus TaxID=2970927 RepID=UPI0021CB077F|nr:hypothetical protein [Lacticaseibacillus parakribbianus]